MCVSENYIPNSACVCACVCVCVCVCDIMQRNGIAVLKFP